MLHIQVASGKESFNNDGGVELHDCWIATLRRCEHLWQYCQCSEHVTTVLFPLNFFQWSPCLFTRPYMVFVTRNDSALGCCTSLWDWMTQPMDCFSELGYIQRPVLNVTHCPEDDQCNLVEMSAQESCLSLCWFTITHAHMENSI